MFDERGGVAKSYRPDAAGRELIEEPALRPAAVPPPCGVCPKWEGQAGDPAPLAGDEDLFAAAWFHDCRDVFLEGRAVGGFGEPDPFTRAVLTEFDLAERRLDRREAGDTLAAVARLIARRG